VQQVAQRLDPVFPARVAAVAVGRLEDQQVAGIGPVGVGQDRGVAAAEVAGEEHPIRLALVLGEGEEDKAGAEDMAGIAELEGDPPLQGEGLVEFEAPGEVVDLGLQAVDVLGGSGGEGEGIAEHRQKECLGGVGADNLAAEAGLDQFRHPADVVDMGVGEEEVVDLRREDWELGEREDWVVAVGGAAVDQDVEVGGLDEVTGTGYGGFGAQVGDFYGAGVGGGFVHWGFGWFVGRLVAVRLPFLVEGKSKISRFASK